MENHNKFQLRHLVGGYPIKYKRISIISEKLSFTNCSSELPNLCTETSLQCSNFSHFLHIAFIFLGLNPKFHVLFYAHCF